MELEHERSKSVSNGAGDKSLQQKRMTNGSIDDDSSAAQYVALQDALDKSTKDLKDSVHRYTELAAKYVTLSYHVSGIMFIKLK